MPRGVAVGSLAIGGPGAYNAGLMAAQILATNDPFIAARLDAFRIKQSKAVLDNPDPRVS